MNGIIPIPPPVNEPLKSYAPGSPERESLKKRLDQMLKEEVDVPAIIGGQEVRTGKTIPLVCPHDFHHKLGVAHQVSEKEVKQAIAAAKKAWMEWSEMPWEARAAVFLKAADLIAGPWRDTINASTMLGQSKTVFQAEIDAAAEIADFWRFNPHYMRKVYEEQPMSAPGIWDYVEYRPLEGFVFAVSPFNFTSIGANLSGAPALMGNVVLWKPASTAILSNYYIMKIFQAAGLPDGVINFVPGRGASVGNPVFASPDFAGLHFTGSTDTFQAMWRTIANTLPQYRGYPRIVGETGGKDFIFAHPSSDVEALAVAMVRGAFEYQGQKCSAASRAYVPKSLWPKVRKSVEERVASLKMGPPTDFRNFLCAVIDEAAFKSIAGYIGEAKKGKGYKVVCGGRVGGGKGWYIEPTVVLSSDPKSKLMSEEIFGPVLTVFVYDDSDLDKTLKLCDTTSPYALTGAIFGTDRGELEKMKNRLRHAAGNFYINDKPTGAVVGQQPFGGARASGTNDKAGSALNLLRWVSQRLVKENFVPPTNHTYPFMGAK